MKNTFACRIPVLSFEYFILSGTSWFNCVARKKRRSHHEKSFIRTFCSSFSWSHSIYMENIWTCSGNTYGIKSTTVNSEKIFFSDFSIHRSSCPWHCNTMKYLFLLFHNGKAIHKEDFKLEKKTRRFTKI